MGTQMPQAALVQSRIAPERVGDLRTATERMVAALDTAQPERMRYACCLLPDDETFRARLQVEEGLER